MDNMSLTELREKIEKNIKPICFLNKYDVTKFYFVLNALNDIRSRNGLDKFIRNERQITKKYIISLIRDLNESIGDDIVKMNKFKMKNIDLFTIFSPENSYEDIIDLQRFYISTFQKFTEFFDKIDDLKNDKIITLKVPDIFIDFKDKEVVDKLSNQTLNNLEFWKNTINTLKETFEYFIEVYNDTTKQINIIINNN